VTRIMCRRAGLKLLWLAVVVGSIAPSQASDPSARPPQRGQTTPVPTKADVAYGGRSRQVLDFWQAASDKPTPLMIYFHGGGFKKGGKQQIGRDIRVEDYLRRGISCVSANYPFTNELDIPTICKECERVITFVRSKEKEWNIDPARIGVSGCSAGAIIAFWIGTQRSEDVSVIGATQQPLGTALLIPHITQKMPPCIIFQRDPERNLLHAPANARMIRDACAKHGVEWRVYGGGTNELDTPPDGGDKFTVMMDFYLRQWGMVGVGPRASRATADDASADASDDDAPKPNIVLVMADDQGWGQVGYNGHPTLKTPNLDAMAAAGIRFNRFYAAASTCSPTRASVLTGRTPHRTGVPAIGHRLCLQEKTLPRALQQAGYATAHFGKWHLNGVEGAGVPVLGDDPNHPGHYGFDEWLSTTNFFDLDPLMGRNGTFVALQGDGSEAIVNEALAFMKRKAAEPFLAVIWYGSPHFPWSAGADDTRGLPQGPKGRLANHLGELAALDRSIGALRQGLRDMGIEKRTLVWYCSDNGGLPDDPDSVGRLRGHKGSIWEGGIRVPGIVEWPGHVRPAVTDVPASTMDIFPTVVDLVALPAKSLLDVHDGESILPLFDGEVPKRTHAIPFTAKGTALIDGDFKLISVGMGKNRTWELFDVRNDPGETSDVSAAHPDRVRMMRAEAERVLASVEASAAGHDYPEGAVIQPQRNERWGEMDAYKPHRETFQKLRPGFTVKGERECETILENVP
jgi:arylsulfatase A-like enzyme/acetyl esterase/lipase